uniref:Uncharacterized protein n=1 Tax=Rhizophora mucronata TaxID=61149 RepID=A0A2P2R336_RHIMU
MLLCSMQVFNYFFLPILEFFPFVTFVIIFMNNLRELSMHL